MPMGMRRESFVRGLRAQTGGQFGQGDTEALALFDPGSASRHYASESRQTGIERLRPFKGAQPTRTRAKPGSDHPGPRPIASAGL